MENNNENNSIEKLQKKVDALIQDFGGYWPPMNMLASIIEELGELSRELNSLEGIKPKKSQTSSSLIGEEIGDIFFSLICMANYFNIDLNQQLDSVIKKYKKRDENRFIDTY